MLKSLKTTYPKPAGTIARTALIIVAFISFVCFHHSPSSRAETDQDGPVAVKYGNLFKAGDLKIESFGLAGLPPLPAGYAALNNTAYRITTSAVVSGPHTIRFVVSSVTEEDTFRKLRIFHIDNDPFDPDGFVWVDVTELNSATSSPSFSAKTIFGKSESLGTYVVAKLVREVPPTTETADLVVTTKVVVDRVTAPGFVSYTIYLSNHGPDNATDVGVWDEIAGPVDLVSVEPSQGECKPGVGQLIVCKIGSLKAGQSITVAVKLRPNEGRGSFPKEGKEITHEAGAKAVENEPTPQNNEASDTVLVFPDPNQPPNITLISPKDEELFVGPADITLQATAEDSDGSISKVEFFDGNKSLGLGTSADGKNFVLTARGFAYGNHYFVAVATDNGGRIDWSVQKGVFVNGLSVVSVKTPGANALVPPGSDLIVAASAMHPAGVIKKLQFFANGRLLGEGSLSEANTYTFNWKGLQRGSYSMSAIAIDGSDIPTVSTPVKFVVGKRPEVAIISPAHAPLGSVPTNLIIAATAKQSDGAIRRVDFYANGRLIGSASDIATDTFSFIWRNVPAGKHTLKAVAVDDLGVSETSKSITLSVEKTTKVSGINDQILENARVP
jgi:uncharacterized repeat protein (TIGR01451 family)